MELHGYLQIRLFTKKKKCPLEISVVLSGMCFGGIILKIGHL